MDKDYSKFGKKNDIINEFRGFIDKNQDLAVGYMDNLLGILLSKEIGHDRNNMLMYVIKYGKDKVAMHIIDKNVLNLNHTNVNNENALLFAVMYGRYKVAIKILDTGLSNAAQQNKDGYEAIEYIEFDDVENDPDKQEKIELLIKLLYYYIENDITTSDAFQKTIEYICSKPETIKLLKNKLKTKSIIMSIDIEKFKQYINLDNPELFCSAPITTEASNLVNVLTIVSEPIVKSSSDLKAKIIKKKKPVNALPDTEEYFDENDYDSHEEEEFLLPPRNYRGGKNKSKRPKQKNKKTKTRKLR